MGIWDSKVIDGGTGLIKWHNLAFSGSLPEGAMLYMFIKNSATVAGLTGSWTGPFMNTSNSILTYTGRYLMVRMVLTQTGTVTPGYGYNPTAGGPIIDWLKITGITSGNASVFYTKTFDLDFNPRHILVTSESTIPTGSVIRFAVTNVDTVDTGYYQYINENEITLLNTLPVTGRKLKLLIEMSGESGSEIVVHEFAMMFSGEDQNELNR